jgi:hypothetical protein
VTDETTEEPTDGDRDEPSPRRRGSLVLYAVAFGLMVVAIACLVVGALGIASYVVVAETSFFGTQRILRVSALFSGLAIVAAVAAVFVPRRSR